MQLVFAPAAWEEYLYWQREDVKALLRINLLLKEAMRDPFRGTGKPEPLSGNLTGWWSRRINQEHRLVYRLRGKGGEQVLEVGQCRYHY